MIKKLMLRFGFMTFEEHHREMEQFREECERFACDYLTAGHGFSVQSPGELCNGGIDSHAAVISSGVLFKNLIIRKGIIVAPWTKNVVLDNIYFHESAPEYPKLMKSFICIKGEYTPQINAELKSYV